MEGLSKIPVFYSKEKAQPRKLSKGEKKGWIKISEYKPIKLKDEVLVGEKLEVYPIGMFCNGKIVP